MPEDDLRSKIKNWLETQGYPLEMRVARTLREAGCEAVEQSTFYDAGGTWREIDVAAQRVARFAFPLHPNRSHKDQEPVCAWFDFVYICECKSSRQASKPWLVFTDHSSDPTDIPFGRSHMASALGSLWFESMIFPLLRMRPAYFQPRRFGYSATCARLSNASGHENTDDLAYKAITAVLDAASAKSMMTSDQFEFFRLVIPIVVINAPLFECYLDEAGAVQLDACEEMAVLWRKPGNAFDDAIVYIVRESALRSFIERANVAHEVLYENCRDEMMAAARAEAQIKRKRESEERKTKAGAWAADVASRSGQPKKPKKSAVAKTNRRT